MVRRMVGAPAGACANGYGRQRAVPEHRRRPSSRWRTASCGASPRRGRTSGAGASTAPDVGVGRRDVDELDPRTSPRSPKSADLARVPALSLTYWAPDHDTCTADCDAEFRNEPADRQAGWDRFAGVAPPLGYEPSIIPAWPSPDAPDFGVLRLTPAAGHAGHGDDRRDRRSAHVVCWRQLTRPDARRATTVRRRTTAGTARRPEDRTQSDVVEVDIGASAGEQRHGVVIATTAAAGARDQADHEQCAADELDGARTYTLASGQGSP